MATAVVSSIPIASLKLNLGAGETKMDGFQSVDLYGNPDYKVNLFEFPWPFADGCAEQIHCSHFFEHVPGKLRGKFMDELWRIMKPCGCVGDCPVTRDGAASLPCPVPGGSALFITPWWASARAVQDYTHEWPPIAPTSYCYFNRKWRELNRLGHYLCTCDFNFSYGFALEPETALRNAETQAYWALHYVNTVSDLHTTLTKRGK
jgi:hypothetical protein